MKSIDFTINFILLIAGFLCIIAGLYVGLWEFLIGGIVNIIDGAKCEPTCASSIAIGIVKIILFELPIVIGTVLGVWCFGSIKKIN